MNEKQLIQACSNNDRTAQRQLFDTYYTAVFRLARRYLSDYHEAEDLTVTVFNKALKSIGHFEYRGDGSLKKWLNTITINEAIKCLKKVRHIHYQDEPIEEDILAGEPPPLDVEMVNLILAKMPEGYRTVFNLYAIDGYTHSEIAELLNISRNTSKSQLMKARKFIIKELHQGKAYGT